VEKIKDPIGDNLRKTRESRDVSVPELAEIIGIPKDRIYKWEQGKAAPQYEDRLKLEAWINGTWNNIPLNSKVEEPSVEYGGKINYEDELIKTLKEQNAYLRKLVDSSLNELSFDVNNNAAAIRAEIRGYAHRQILKEVNYDDDEFLKAKAEADKIYLLSLKQLLGDNKTGAGNQHR
jgi:transcriptional regulator with XRE-family HTH domain